MKKWIGFKQAAHACLFLFGLLIIFHVSIIVGILLFDYAPTDYLWGGRMKTKEELLGFEFISLVIIILCFFSVLIRVRKLNWPQLVPASKITMWVLFALFLLNTLGNILAKTRFEQFFAILTFVLALLCLRLAIKKNLVN